MQHRCSRHRGRSRLSSTAGTRTAAVDLQVDGKVVRRALSANRLPYEHAAPELDEAEIFYGGVELGANDAVVAATMKAQKSDGDRV